MESFPATVQFEPPSPSWTAFRSWVRGELFVHSDRAEFVPREGDRFSISNVLSVGKGWRNQKQGKPLLPMVDTWIEVSFGDPKQPQFVYVNDQRWLGLASYLPHRRLWRALEGLANPASS